MSRLEGLIDRLDKFNTEFHDYTNMLKSSLISDRYHILKYKICITPDFIVDTFDLQFSLLEDMLDLIKYEIVYDNKTKTCHIRSLCGSDYMSLKEAVNLYNSGDVIPDKYKYIQNINLIRNKKSPVGISVTSNLVKLLK